MGRKRSVTVNVCRKANIILYDETLKDAVDFLKDNFGMADSTARDILRDISKGNSINCQDGTFEPLSKKEVITGDLPDAEPEIDLDSRIRENTKRFEDPDFKGDLEEFVTKQKYWFDKERKTYVYLTERKLGRNIQMPKDKVDALVNLYSNFDDKQKSINECSKRLGIPQKWVKAILTAHGITHDSLPYTDEDIAETPYDQLLEGMVEEKRFSLWEDYQQVDWKEIKKNSDKYLEIKFGQIDPFQSFIENWHPKQYKVKLDKRKKISDELQILLELSDFHFGKIASGESMYNGSEYNINEAKALIEKLAEAIYKRMSILSVDVQIAYLACLGDMLDSWNSETEKGTRIETQPVREELFEITYESLYYFTLCMLELFKKVNYQHVSGNHFPFGDYVLFRMLDKEFKLDERVNVNVSQARWNHFKVLNSFFVMEHGASRYIKSKIPRGETQRESYILRLFLKNQEEMQGTKHRYFLTADQHSFERKEFPDFEFIQFSTPVKGDPYADELNLRSRPRQNAFLIDKSGVFDNLSFYLD